MKNIYQTMAISSANLLALGLNIGDATTLKPYFSSSAESNHVQAMNDGQLRTIEASHLEVYAGCKWGHAAFDPTKVDSEELSQEVRDIYNQMA